MKKYTYSKLIKRSTYSLQRLWDKLDYEGGTKNKNFKILLKIEGILLSRGKLDF